MNFGLRLIKAAAVVPAVAAMLLLSGCGESSTKTGSADTSTPTGTSASTTSTTAEAFVREAAQGNMAEVQMGKLASTKADNPDVKNFAKHMIDDHSTNEQKLKDLASKKGVTLPTEVSENDKHEMAQLEKLNGAEFDRAYMNAMVQDHQKDVSKFENESNTAKDSDVKAYASETLPTLQQHLQMAKDVNTKLQGPQAAGENKSGQPVEVRHDTNTSTSTSKATTTSTESSR